ncbi:MAG: histone deacetylase family protein [Planctomycetota bacterium]
MFRVRRVFDDLLPEDADAVRQVTQILKEQFPDLRPREIQAIPKKLKDPVGAGWRTILFVAEKQREVRGFALVLHAPDESFCYLDYIAAGMTRTGSGVGGALYQRVREEVRLLGAVGLFLECLPDDLEHCPEPELRKENARRLRFYENYGARPLDGNAYQTPIDPGDTHMPVLVYDGLDPDRPLARTRARRVVRAILERKYGDLCPALYVDKVVASFKDDPVKLRPYLYVKEPAAALPGTGPLPVEHQIALTINKDHEIHHVRERGYVESPVRIATIQREVDKLPFMTTLPVRSFPDRHVEAVHDRAFLSYLKTVCDNTPEGESVYPYVFPIRNAARPPKELAVRAGYFCIDTLTPLHRNVWRAARGAVNCALTVADALLQGHRLAYALVRPPGHHAETRTFGGFCYLNSTAIAAQYLAGRGRVAILDIDYHHGNGQQEIFYRRRDVLTISIHGHPRFAYPYFSGFEDERGEGEGTEFNRNYPLAEATTPEQYAATLHRALGRIHSFKPTALVVALGLDTAQGDPTGTWSLRPKNFEENGRQIGLLRLPTLVVQEGGYRTRTLGINLRNFLLGLRQGMLEAG